MKEKEKTSNEFEIPVEGSLGLLALGYRGVLAWRKVRDKALGHSPKGNPK